MELFPFTQKENLAHKWLFSVGLIHHPAETVAKLLSTSVEQEQALYQAMLDDTYAIPIFRVTPPFCKPMNGRR